MPTPATTPSAVYKDPTSADLYYKPDSASGLFQKIAGPAELQNLAKSGAIEVGKPYQDYTPPAAPPGGTTPPPLASTESKPGVFDANKLVDFFTNQIETYRPKYEAATKTLEDVNATIAGMRAPDYSALYGTEYAAKVAPLDVKIQEVGSKINTIDTSIRKIEDDLRATLGGQAPESIIKAEAARRAAPLLQERQSLTDEFTTLSTSRTNALQGVTTGIGYKQASFADEISMAVQKATLAQDVVTQFNALVEKGAAASDKEVDNFRQMFSTLLTQAPDVLRTLTPEETDQLKGGFLPSSVMEKISKTINEQKLGAANVTPAQILTRASQIQQIASALGQVISTEDAIAQATAEFQSLGGRTSPTGAETGAEGVGGGYDASQYVGPTPPQGTVSFRTNNPGNIKWGDFAASVGGTDSGIKATDGGTFAQFPSLDEGINAQMKLLQSSGYANLTVDAAMKRWSNSGYGAEIVQGVIPANKIMNTLTPSELSSLQKAMQKREGFAGPTGGGSTPSEDSFGAYLASKEQSAGMTFSLAKREALRKKYESGKGGKIETPTDGTFAEVRDTKYNAQFTPQFYGTAYGQKVLNNEQQSKSAFEGKQAYKDMQTVRTQYDTVRNLIAEEPAGAADMAVIFSFMKALDPNSVVRETEYETAASKTANVFKGWAAKLNAYVNEKGAFLAPEARQSMLDALDAKTRAQVGSYNSIATNARKDAEEQGLNPNHVAVTIKFSPSKVTVSGGSSKASGGSSSISNLNFKF